MLKKKAVKKAGVVIRSQRDDDEAQTGANIPPNAEADCASVESQEEVAEVDTISEAPEQPAQQNLTGYDDDGCDEEDDDSLIAAYEAQMIRAEARRREEEEDGEPALFPLRARFEPPKPFPKGSLPPLLEKWAEALAARTRGNYAVAVMMTVAMINLVLQAHGNIRMWGRPKPLSLFILIIAGSGSKKSGIYERLMVPVERFVDFLRSDQGDPAKEPDPTLVVHDPTTASILVDLPASRTGTMGLLLDEASLFLGSYALSNENSLGMIGLLSKLWDGLSFTISRKGSGKHHISRKRFSLMLASPMAPFLSLLGNALIRQQGFLSRVLMIAPGNEKRDRLSPEEEVSVEKILKTYDRFMYKILELEPPMWEDTANDLDPPLLTLTPEAEDVIEAFVDEITEMREALAEEDPVHDVVNKHAEIAGRLAAVFTLVADINARFVDETAATRAVLLVRHCMHESIRLVSPAASSPHADLAERIVHWLAKKRLAKVTRTELLKASVGRKPTVAEFDPALKLLIASGWLVEEATARKGGGRSKHVYILTRAAKNELRFGA